MTMQNPEKNLYSKDPIKEHFMPDPECGNTNKFIMKLAKNHVMKRRIHELEAEVEELRSTVKFLQDIYLRED